MPSNAPCTCTTITEYVLNCTPSIGGISQIKIVTGTGETPTETLIQTRPDTSSFNAAMTYDKTKNLKYWTIDITAGIDGLDTAASTLADNLACPVGRTIKLYLNNGKNVTVTDAFIQTATFESGAAKTDGNSGTLVFQAITAAAPAVA